MDRNYLLECWILHRDSKVKSALSSPYTTSGATFRKLSSRPHSMYEWPSCNSPSARSTKLQSCYAAFFFTPLVNDLNSCFSPGSLSSASVAAYSSSTEDVDNTRHQSLNHYPYLLPSDGKLSSDRPITEVPDEYLKMSMHEDKKVGHSFQVIPEKLANAQKKNDYIDMRASSVSKSDSIKKQGNFIPVPRNCNATGESSSSRDGYLDMSPSNSSKNGLSFHFKKEVNFNEKTDADSKPYELEKVLSLVKVDENVQNNPIEVCFIFIEFLV
ncbi:UNVERIFIED_CONTAM: hypothetical protein NCL1_41037 [Trichonephila clavipes]